jgi:hypothetical protein
VSACEVNTPKVVVPVIRRIAAFMAYPTTYSRLQKFRHQFDRYKMNHTGKALLYGFVPLWL